MIFPGKRGWELEKGHRGSPPRRTSECERYDSSARLTLSVPKTHSERGDSEKWRQEGEVVSARKLSPGWGRRGLGGRTSIYPRTPWIS